MRSFILCLFLMTAVVTAFSQNDKKQMIKPSELALILNDIKKTKPVIFNIGPVGDIKYSERGGTVSTEEGFKQFQILAGYYPKQTEMVVYCGCCTLDNCPNIRKAYDYLVAAGFKNVKILDLPTGLTEDWIAKGYPMK